MSNKANFEAKLNIFQAMSNGAIKTPSIPVDVYLQEAEDLYHWAKTDELALKGAGLNAEMLEDLPLRTDACRYAESNWFNAQHTKEEAQKEWDEKSPAAYELNQEVMHAYRYAFRKDATLLSKVATIAEGYGNADMLQDASDLALLGRDNLGLLNLIGFDVSKIETLENNVDELSVILARANGEKLEGNEPLLLRNKAYSHLKEAVDEIRACGKYVFWKNDERVKGYRSAYLKKYRN